jgi:hypothetical protein
MRTGRCWLLVLVALGLPVLPARAWKPRTHVYLAEQALADALNDGQVTLFRVDPGTNALLLRDGQPVELGRFPVRADALEALRGYPSQFRAGVLGPDAFPDIITGQTIIHPAGKVTPGETGVDLNAGGVGTDPWLQHLWERAFHPGDERDATPANRAFVLGVLAHAAGDMYGHTLVNHYTGDAFHFRPEPTNAIRHIVLEGYVDRRVPDPTFETSIGSGTSGFIHRNMVLARNGSRLEQLQAGDSAKLSIPAYFSRLRIRLTDSLPGSSRPVAAYKRAWIQDIDDGLTVLPEVSHGLALDLFFNKEGRPRVARARERADDYVKKHLLSMCGLPDAAGASLLLFDQIVAALGLDELRAMAKALKRNALSYLLERAVGLSLEQVRTYLTSPEEQFDPVLDRDPLPGGTRISRRQFDELKLEPGSTALDYRRVPAAYNTVTLCKLLLLDRDAVNHLLQTLESPERLAEENIMLGFIETLDGSRQWKANERRMVLARDPAAYRALFMRQSGEDR